MNLPPNCKLISDTEFPFDEATHTIHGHGVPIAVVEVTEEGYGFQETGKWVVMEWQHAKDRNGQRMKGFDYDDGTPYACGPIFIG